MREITSLDRAQSVRNFRSQWYQLVSTTKHAVLIYICVRTIFQAVLILYNPHSCVFPSQSKMTNFIIQIQNKFTFSISFISNISHFCLPQIGVFSSQSKMTNFIHILNKLIFYVFFFKFCKLGFIFKKKYSV